MANSCESSYIEAFQNEKLRVLRTVAGQRAYSLAVLYYPTPEEGILYVKSPIKTGLTNKKRPF